MKLHPRVTQTAVDLAKRFEGFRPRAGKTPDRRYTIGYGHILGARDKPDEVEISEAEAEFLLKLDLSRVAEEIEPSILAPLNDNQFAALLSFAFNIGSDNFKGSSALRRLNEGAYLQAAAALELWRRAEFDGETLVVDQLVRRRAVEKALFLAPPEGFTPVPSAVLRPTFDHSVIGAAVAWAAARERTAVSRLALEGPDVSAGLAIPPGREGEPAPSAAIAAADALTVRLSRIIPENVTEPEEALPPAPEPLALHSEPASRAPDSIAPTPAPLDLAAPPHPGEEPTTSAPLAFADPIFSNPLGPFPAASLAASSEPLADPLPAKALGDHLDDASPLRGRFGARIASAMQTARSSFPTREPRGVSSLSDPTGRSSVFDNLAVEPAGGAGGGAAEPPVTPLFERPIFFAALGVLGVALFIGSIFCMLNKASFTCLLVGVVGVLAMATAAAFFLFRFLEGQTNKTQADHARAVQKPPTPLKDESVAEEPAAPEFNRSEWR